MKRSHPLGALFAGLLAAASLSIEASALAQDASAPKATPPDIVKLKDGSMYRGVIMELAVGDHVTLRLDSGESMRFVAADVAYAGSADAAPAPPLLPLPPLPPAPPPPPPASPESPPPVPVSVAEAKVRFESASPDVDFHLRTEDATAVGWSGRGGYVVLHGYKHICAAPCDATLPAGRQRLALSQSGGVPIEADDVVDISGPSKVTGTYESHRGTRTTGLIVLLGSPVVGGIMMAASIHSGHDCSEQAVTGSCSPTTNLDGGLLGGGIAVVTVGTLAGLLLMLQGDHATITVAPLDAAAASPRPSGKTEGAWLAASPAASAPGLGVRLTF
jgi:homeobox protein ESX1